MADGELEAVFKGLASDTDEAAGKIANSVAEVAETAADNEDAALTNTLETDAGAAQDITAAGARTPPTEGTAPSSVTSRLEGDETPPVQPTGPIQPSGTPDPNATPGGRVTRIGENNDADTKRSLQRENESATAMARAGYDVEQNPAVPGNKNPDYRVEGEVFDNYAPKTANPRNIAGWIQTKVEEGQADRIVLNLTDSSVDPARLSAQLHDWPIEGLKEVKTIDGQGNVIDFFP